MSGEDIPALGRGSDDSGDGLVAVNREIGVFGNQSSPSIKRDETDGVTGHYGWRQVAAANHATEGSGHK